MMRNIIVLAFLLPLAAFGQKKPNVNKALRSAQSGDLAEAKQTIDEATTYEKTKDDGKTWYYRGLIYVTIDTTSSAAAKNLATEPLKTAMESFDKADAMNTKKGEYYLLDTAGNQITKSAQLATLKDYYMNNAIILYQDSSDYKGSINNFLKVNMMNPKDTTGFYYAGLIANEGEMYDSAIDYLNKALDLGATSNDIFNTLYLIYNDQKEDKEKALELVKHGEKVHPENDQFGKLEIGLLIDLGRNEQAKQGLIEAVKNEPDNKILHFYLGYIYTKTNEPDKAKPEFEQALRLDPNYFEAQLYLARTVSEKSKAVKQQMNMLGISKADMQKKLDLDKQYVEELKKTRPYWEKAEKLKPDDSEVLDQLYNIYSDLGLEDQTKRIEQRYKDLGLNTQ